MKKLTLFLLACLLLAACGQSYEETKQQTRRQRRASWRQDSAALKIAVMPTLDCLPLYVARQERLLDTLYGGVRLKHYAAQMDCDTALLRGRVEGMVTDLVRAKRIERGGMKLRYTAVTSAYWQLLSNRNSRIRQLRQLDDKMVAMTRYSVTDMLSDLVVDSAKLQHDRVFKVQVNDVGVRLQMLQNNELDALWFTEPQATQARLMKNPVVYDTRDGDQQLGILVFSEKEMQHQARSRQLDLLIKAYDRACDLINERGVAYYRDLIVQHCMVKPQHVDSLPRTLKYQHARGPREQDLKRVDAWLDKVMPAKQAKRDEKPRNTRNNNKRKRRGNKR